MLKKSLWVSIVSLLGSGLSFINQLVIASYFGTQKTMDVFFAITSIPVLFGALLNISLSYYLTPHLKKIKLQQAETYYAYCKLLLKRLIGYAGLLFCIGGLLSFFISHVFFKVPISYYSISLTVFCLLASFLSIIIAFFTSFFSVAENFTLPIFSGFLPIIGSIVFVVIWHTRLSVLSCQIGAFIGTAIACYILFFKSNIASHLANNNTANKKQVNQFLLYMPYVAISMLSFTVYQSIDSFWAPKLGVSNLAYLAYAQRIIVAVGLIVVTGPSAILVPKLTEYAVLKNETLFYNTAIYVLKIILLLSSLVAVIGSVLKTMVVQFIFERGKFTHTDTLAMGNVLPGMLVGMCFMLSFTILYRIFFITASPKKTALVGVSSTLLYFLLSGIGSLYFGVVGISFAYAATWAIVFIALFLVTFSNGRIYIKNKANLFFLLQLPALFVSSYLVLNYLLNTILAHHLIGSNIVIQLCILSTISIGVYLFIGAYLLRVNVLTTGLATLYNLFVKKVYKNLYK